MAYVYIYIYIYFTKNSLKRAARYLFHNSYFRLDDKIFSQTIVIIIGSDPVASFPNYFLFHYESK